MSAPVDVLAVLDESIRRAEERGNIERSDRLQAARAAVAELIAADLEYDAACIHVGEAMFGCREQRKLAAARSARSNFRRIAAIARVQGGAA